MDFNRIPSLEYLTGVKIGLVITYNPDVAHPAFQPQCDSPIALREVFDMLDDKILSLTLPMKFRKKIKIITMNIIRELVIWSRRHSDIISSSQMSMTYLCWTTLGAIDRWKTAHKMINGLYLDTRTRYRLACEYCFLYDVSAIFEAMSEEEKERSHNPTFVDSWVRRPKQRCQESFISWIEPHIDDCGPTELRFILDTKTTAERMPILRTVALNQDFSPEFRQFCFRHLDEDTQQEVLEKAPVEVLQYFLKWPFQSFFLDLADRVLTNITPANFSFIIQAIVDNMCLYWWKNYELLEILQQLWQRSPAHFKVDANQSSVSELLKIFLNCDCLESLSLDRINDAFRINVRSRLVLINSEVSSNFDFPER